MNAARQLLVWNELALWGALTSENDGTDRAARNAILQHAEEFVSFTWRHYNKSRLSVRVHVNNAVSMGIIQRSDDDKILIPTQHSSPHIGSTCFMYKVAFLSALIKRIWTVNEWITKVNVTICHRMKGWKTTNQIISRPTKQYNSI